MNDEATVLEKVKRKIKDLHEVDDVKDGRKDIFFGNYGDRSRSRDRRDPNQQRERYRSDSRKRFRSKSFHRSSSRPRDNSKGREFQKDGQGKTFNKDGRGQSPKRTYKVEKMNLDTVNKTIFDNEVENQMLIDSGCPEMVCGAGWMKTYESACGKQLEKVEKFDNFKFGNSVFKSSYAKIVPFKIGKLEEKIEVSIVDANIPMLLSKKKLREWGAQIDFSENKMYLKKTRETIQLNEVTQGHLTYPMAKNVKNDCEELIHSILLVKKDGKIRMKEIRKIHRIFGHPTADKLRQLLKDAGKADPVVVKILQKIQDTCKICKKHKKRSSRPKVGLPKSREVNETVCVDLKPVSSILKEDSRKQIVYMVDSFSSFTAAGISDSKEANKVADVILKKWCLSGIGYPGKSWFCDNGNEFKKEHLEEISRKTGRKIELTPSHSPWSNGQCERRHAVIDMTIKKMMEDDPDLKLEDALEHAIWAKNMEIGRHGLSPYQVVYGKSPFLPGISEGTPMSDGIITDADVIRRHL